MWQKWFGSAPGTVSSGAKRSFHRFDQGNHAVPLQPINHSWETSASTAVLKPVSGVDRDGNISDDEDIEQAMGLGGAGSGKGGGIRVKKEFRIQSERDV